MTLFTQKGKAPEGVNTDSVEKASNKKGSDSTNIDLKIPGKRWERQYNVSSSTFYFIFVY